MRTAREVLSADPSLEALFAEMRTAEEARAPLGCTAAAASLFAVLLLFGSCSALFDKNGATAAIVPAVAGIGLAIFAVTRLFRLATQSDRAAACFGRFVRRTVELALDEGQYLPGAGIPESVVLASGLYPSGDEYDSGDLVGGKEGSTSFHFARVLSENVEIETDSDGNETENRTTVFSGVWFVADFNKHFHSRTPSSKRTPRPKPTPSASLLPSMFCAEGPHRRQESLPDRHPEHPLPSRTPPSSETHRKKSPKKRLHILRNLAYSQEIRAISSVG